jgi:hypothetical protein
VAETSYPWDPPGAGSSINAGEWRYLARCMGLAVPGVLKNDLSELLVSAGSGMAVSVAAGRAGCDGTLYENSTAQSITAPNNNTGATRYDAVVVRYNWGSKTASADYITGNATPPGPGLTRSRGGSGTYDVLLAHVAVPNGAGAITGGMISDRREFAIAEGGSWGPAPLRVLGGDTQPGTSEAVWPGGCTKDVYVPDWAETCDVLAEIGQVQYLTSDYAGYINLMLGSTLMDTQTVVFGAAGVPTSADVVLRNQRKDISALQGSVQALEVVARKTSGSGIIRANNVCVAHLEIVFRP